MRVLLVEDDPSLGSAVADGLRQEHLAVDWCTTVAEAEEAMILTAYDVLCLDLTLPDGDGVDLCRRLHEPAMIRPRRVLMLTARDDVSDRVRGLDAGADDYLVKPFKIAELAARVRALMRRHDQEAVELIAGDITIDLAKHEVQRSRQPIALTSREYSVLRYLAQRPGEIVSAEELLEHCWDANANDLSGTVKVIVSRLRSKLGTPSPITTVRGAGYRLDVST